jgi:hypothetical protein
MEAHLSTPRAHVGAKRVSNAHGNHAKWRSKWTAHRRRFAVGRAKPQSHKNEIDVSIPAWRIHDLRRPFSTGCARIGIAPHVVELCLNHKLAGVAGTYNKFKYEKEMAAAWEKWSAHISETALKVRKA